MSQVKLYRGGINSSLPNALEDGAIYVLKTSNSEADVYTYYENQVVKLGSNCSVEISTTADWNSQVNLISQNKTFYIYSDKETYIDENENSIDVPAVKIGDGTTYLIDLPFVTVTPQQIEFWNNKLNYDETYLVNETLAFNRL